MSPRNLVTGGAGFVGSHLVDRLMQAGEEVICRHISEVGDQQRQEYTEQSTVAIKSVGWKPQYSANVTGKRRGTQTKTTSQPFGVECDEVAACVIARLLVSIATLEALRQQPDKKREAAKQSQKVMDPTKDWYLASAKLASIQLYQAELTVNGVEDKSCLTEQAAMIPKKKPCAKRVPTTFYGSRENHQSNRRIMMAWYIELLRKYKQTHLPSLVYRDNWYPLRDCLRVDDLASAGKHESKYWQPDTVYTIEQPNIGTSSELKTEELVGLVNKRVVFEIKATLDSSKSEGTSKWEPKASRIEISLWKLQRMRNYNKTRTYDNLPCGDY